MEHLSEGPDALSSALGRQVAKEQAELFLQLYSLGISPLKCIRIRTESAQLSFAAVVFGFLLNIRPHHAVGQPRHWLSLSGEAPWPVLRGRCRN